MKCSDPVSMMILCVDSGGDGRDVFYVRDYLFHEEVACLYSPMFAEALDSQTTLDTKADSAALRRPVHWLYSRKLTLHHSTKLSVKKTTAIHSAMMRTQSYYTSSSLTGLSTPKHVEIRGI